LSPADQGPSEFQIAARRVAASVIEGLELRLQLLSLELTEERQRLASVVLAALLLALALFMLFLCGNAALLIVFWDTHRVPVALGLCGLYAVLAAGLGLWIALRRRRRAPPFAATREVLARDHRGLRGPR
jgi:uncharacterized membrane protein YqjE